MACLELWQMLPAIGVLCFVFSSLPPFILPSLPPSLAPLLPLSLSPVYISPSLLPISLC